MTQLTNPNATSPANSVLSLASRTASLAKNISLRLGSGTTGTGA